MGSRRLRLTLLVAGTVVAAVISQAMAATPSADLLACQTRFKSKVNGFARFTATKIHVCTEKVAKCTLASEIDMVPPATTADCLAAATTACSGVSTIITNAQALAKTKITLKCGLFPFADLGPFVGGLGFSNVAAGCSTAANLNDLIDCVLNGTKCDVERKVFIRDPRAQDSLSTAGIAGSFPCVAP